MVSDTRTVLHRRRCFLFDCSPPFPPLSVSFPRDYPDIGRTAQIVWNTLSEDAENAICSPFAKAIQCDTDAGAAQPLPADLQVAVFLDLYRLQDFMVHDRCDTDMNALIWSKVLQCYADGAKWKTLLEIGILVCTVDDMPRENSAFITHRWNSVQGVAAMSMSFFQCFVYHMAARGGYAPVVREVQKGVMGLEPLWVWCDYLSVPQRSWASTKKWTADELLVRERLNMKYIQFIGLQFGTLAAQVQFFINYIPMRIECEEEPTHLIPTHPLSIVSAHLQEFGMQPTFHLSKRAQIAADSADGSWGPLHLGVDGWNAWQDQAYIQRIWCVAEYTNVWLRGAGMRVNGCESWYRSFLSHIGGKKGKQLLRGFRASSEQGNHYLVSKQKMAVMMGFAAWQRHLDRGDETRNMQKLTIATICQHLLSFEGMLCSLAPAIATVVSDIPLVLDSFYGEVCRVGLHLDVVPNELVRMRNIILRLCHVGYKLPAIFEVDAATGLPVLPKTPLEDFLDMFVQGGALHQYLVWIAKFMRLGAGSLQWLDALLCWRRILQIHDPARLAATEPFDLDMSVLPDEEVLPGYRYAKRAYSYLHTELGIPKDEIPSYFCPLFTSRGWNGMIALTKPIPMKLGKEDGVTPDYIEYFTSALDPSLDLLGHFTVVKASEFRLLYSVKSSFVNQIEHQFMPSVHIDQPQAIPRSQFTHVPFIDLSEETAHRAIKMGERELGVIEGSDCVLPTEQIFKPTMRALPGGNGTAVWKVMNHVEDWARNFVIIRTNVH
jgi:hypothetical protein